VEGLGRELRKAFIVLAVAVSALTLQGCGEIILTSGLDLDDEFDRAFRRGGGCPSTSLLKQYSFMDRKYCHRAANELVKTVTKNREMGVSPKAYLLSKGGACSEPAKGHWRCAVERVVTETICATPRIFAWGECVHPRRHVERYILTVEGSSASGAIRAEFEKVSDVYGKAY
jgi:hypothetical protein